MSDDPLACASSVIVAVFAAFPAQPAVWRSVVITGFCGGLTTCTTFSVERLSVLKQRRSLSDVAQTLIQLLGSVPTLFAGIGTVAWIRIAIR